MTTTTTCRIGGCVSDHTAATSTHFGKNETVADVKGEPVNLELHYNSTTGQALVNVGGYELTLLGALDLAETLKLLVGVGIVLPGAVGAESARAVE